MKKETNHCNKKHFNFYLQVSNFRNMNQASIGENGNIFPDQEVEQAIPKNSEKTQKIETSDVVKQFSHSKTSKENICDECKKVFSTSKNLKQHIIDIHIGFTRECQICKKQIKDGSFRKHMRNAHENPKQHSCNLCENTFTSKGTLKQHQIDVHDKIRQECEICKITFVTRYFKRHMRDVHLDDMKAFPCNSCENKFTTKSTLKQHVKVVHEKVFELGHPIPS